MKNRRKFPVKGPRFVAALDVGGTNMRAAISGRDGRVLGRVERSSRVLENPSRAAGELARLVREAAGEAGVTLPELVAVGMAVAGGVDAHKGIVTQCPQFSAWRNLKLQDQLMKALKLPVVIINDADAALAGEQWLGSAREIETVAGIFMGTGLGGALILDGRLWHGPSGMAGEFGHLLYDPQGRRCNCGQIGCYETVASGTGVKNSFADIVAQGTRSRLARRFREAPREITAQTIARAAMQGDPAAVEAWDRLADALGALLSALVMGLSVDRFVIGGKIALAWPLFARRADKVMRERSFRYPARRARIFRARLGDNAALAGAAGLAWKAAAQTSK